MPSDDVTKSHFRFRLPSIPLRFKPRLAHLAQIYLSAAVTITSATAQDHAVGDIRRLSVGHWPFTYESSLILPLPLCP